MIPAKRRICYITNLFPPIQTGTGYYVDQLSKAMADDGHHALVITCGGESTAVEEKRGPVHVLRLPSWQLPRNRLLLGFDNFRLGYSPRNVKRALQAISEHRIDVIQVSGHLLDLTYLGVAVARKSGIPAACSIHTMIHHPTPLLNAVVQNADRMLHYRVTMRHFKTLLTLDKVMEQYVRSAYPGVPTIPVPWGVTCNFDDERPQPLGGDLRILSIGHLTEMRSRRALIDAVALLVKQGLNCRLRIVGKICVQSPLDQVKDLKLEKHVEFVGELPRPQILEELKNCDVHAMWISNPGVGSAGMESMYAGVPTMMWADEDQLGFVRLRHLHDCLLIDPSKPQQIADTLTVLANDPSMRAAIGRNAAAVAKANFYWPAIAPRMAEIYERVIAE